MELNAKDINLIITTGFKANCAKIEYNGLIVTYNTQPSVVDSYYPTDLVADKPSLQDELTTKTEVIDDKMFTNPLDYELES